MDYFSYRQFNHLCRQRHVQKKYSYLGRQNHILISYSRQHPPFSSASITLDHTSPENPSLPVQSLTPLATFPPATIHNRQEQAITDTTCSRMDPPITPRTRKHGHSSSTLSNDYYSISGSISADAVEQRNKRYASHHAVEEDEEEEDIERNRRYNVRIKEEHNHNDILYQQPETPSTEQLMKLVIETLFYVC